MILNKLYNTSAKWDKSNNKWNVAERMKYQWNDNRNKPVSPEYKEIESALEWIIEYDMKASSK